MNNIKLSLILSTYAAYASAKADLLNTFIEANSLDWSRFGEVPPLPGIA